MPAAEPTNTFSRHRDPPAGGEAIALELVEKKDYRLHAFGG